MSTGIASALRIRTVSGTRQKMPKSKLNTAIAIDSDITPMMTITPA